MAVPDDSAIARLLETEGYFVRVAQGDQRAASLFARLCAWRLNTSGLTSGWGWLRKGGGANVDGWAEDAIVYGSNLNDFQNVVDTVVGTGAPGASVASRWTALPRRVSDTWARPQPLSEAELAYLRGGVAPGPTPPPVPVPPHPPPLVLPGRAEMMDEGQRLHEYYKAPEGLQRPQGLSILNAPDWEGVGAWLFDVYLQARVKGKSREEARAAYIKAIRQSDEWHRVHPGETP